VVTEIKDIKKKLIILNEKGKLLLQVQDLYTKLTIVMTTARGLGDISSKLTDKPMHSEQSFKDLSDTVDRFGSTAKQAKALTRRIDKLMDKYRSM
jgi:hypothetical protein